MQYSFVDVNGVKQKQALTHERQVENFIAERILDNVPQPWKNYRAPTSGSDKITSITAFRNQNIVIENDVFKSPVEFKDKEQMLLSLVRINLVPPGLPKLAKPIPSTGTTNTSEDVTRRLTFFFARKNRAEAKAEAA